jgi:hypothetical protein
LVEQRLGEWSSLLLCPSNFAVHSFYGQYDLWLIGGVMVFGKLYYQLLVNDDPGELNIMTVLAYL